MLGRKLNRAERIDKARKNLKDIYWAVMDVRTESIDQEAIEKMKEVNIAIREVEKQLVEVEYLLKKNEYC